MPEVITKKIIPASADAIWNVLADTERYHEWNPVITKLKVKGELKPGTPGTLVIYLDGDKKPRVLKMNYLDVEPGKKFSWTGSALGDWFARGKHYFYLNPLPDGTTELVHGEVFKGILFLMMIPFLRKKIETAYHRMNHAVKERCAELEKTTAAAA